MNFIITILCIWLVIFVFYVIAWGFATVAMKMDAKRDEQFIRVRAKVNRDLNEKMWRMVHDRMYGDTEPSEVKDVEYEDLSDEKLLERKL